MSGHGSGSLTFALTFLIVKVRRKDFPVTFLKHGIYTS